MASQVVIMFTVILAVSSAFTLHMSSSVARKMKRTLRSAKDETSFNKIYAPEYEVYMKSAPPGIYDSVMDQMKKTARTLKVTIKSDFAPKSGANCANVVEAAKAVGSFKTLLSVVEKADLADALCSGLITVFAPTDDAFAALEESVLDILLANKDRLTEVLKHHVVDGSNSVKALSETESVVTLCGTTLSVKGDGKTVEVDGAKSLSSIKCSNGNVHVIDTVLMPPEAAQVAEESSTDEAPAAEE